MSDPNDKCAELVAPVRNRKRFLEASEEHEEESNSRRQNLFSEWQETLRSMGVPSKKGKSIDFKQNLLYSFWFLNLRTLS